MHAESLAAAKEILTSDAKPLIYPSLVRARRFASSAASVTKPASPALQGDHFPTSELTRFLRAHLTFLVPEIIGTPEGIIRTPTPASVIRHPGSLVDVFRMLNTLHLHLSLVYDARISRRGFEWPSARRERFLLRTGVKSPLSADRQVWPAPEFSVQPPEWTGPLCPLWSDFSELSEFLSTSDTSADIVAISLSPEEASLSGGLWREELGSAVPKKPPTDWLFIGFDVADGSLLSGIANCGYTDHHMLFEARQKWSYHLNEWHLFEGEDAAHSFREEVATRVPEHAPFFVFGLWIK